MVLIMSRELLWSGCINIDPKTILGTFEVDLEQKRENK